MSLHKSMQASYNLYNKTRPSASKSSVARAKKLLEECGGAAQLQSMLHPSFSVESAKEHGYQPGGGKDSVNLPIPQKEGLMIRADFHHWFPLIRPAIKPLFLGGGRLGRVS